MVVVGYAAIQPHAVVVEPCGTGFTEFAVLGTLWDYYLEGRRDEEGREGEEERERERGGGRQREGGREEREGEREVGKWGRERERERGGNVEAMALKPH